MICYNGLSAVYWYNTFLHWIKHSIKKHPFTSANSNTNPLRKRTHSTSGLQSEVEVYLLRSFEVPRCVNIDGNSMLYQKERDWKYGLYLKKALKSVFTDSKMNNSRVRTSLTSKSESFLRLSATERPKLQYLVCRSHVRWYSLHSSGVIGWLALIY